MEVKQLFKLLRKEAECSFCSHPVSKPKILPCLHSFCLDCLNKNAAIRRQQGQTTFDCPECLATFQLPDNDNFDAFQTAFHKNRLLDILALEKSGTDQQKNCDNCDEDSDASSYYFECQTLLCEVCLDKHNRAHRRASLQNLQTADIEALIQRPVLCDKQYHEREPLEYYCEDCRVCICHKCEVVEHKKHSILEIPRVTEQYKRQIIQDVGQMKFRVSECKQEIEKSKKNFEDVEQQIEEAKTKAQATVEELIQDLKEHEVNIMRELDEVHQTQQQAHLAQVENFELSLAQLNSAIEYAEAIMSRNMAPEILQAKEAITQRCDKLLADQKINAHKSVRVGLITDDELCQTVRQSALGRVVVSLTEPSRSAARRSFFKRSKKSGVSVDTSSVAEGKGLQEARCGEEAEFIVRKKNAEGKQSYSYFDKIKVDIRSAAQDELKVTIKNKKDGTYHVTYIPQRHIQHHVTININKKQLTGSPWNVHVTPRQYQAVSSLSSRGTGKGQLNGPYGVSVSSTGNIAVADYYNKRVQIFNSEGEHLREFGKGILKWPVSLAYISPKHIIVVEAIDEQTSKAVLFTESGTHHIQFSPGHLKSPRSVSVTNDGHVVVCDWSDKAVKVLSPDGKKLLQSFSAPECNASPHYAVYHKEKFYVSYRWINCIKVFDVAGKYLQDIGCKGTGHKQFQHQLGLAIDKFGDLLVADVRNNRLQVFTTEGEFVSKTGGHGTELGQFDTPINVAVSRDGHVYVTDFKNSRVQIFM